MITQYPLFRIRKNSLCTRNSKSRDRVGCCQGRGFQRLIRSRSSYCDRWSDDQYPVLGQIRKWRKCSSDASRQRTSTFNKKGYISAESVGQLEQLTRGGGQFPKPREREQRYRRIRRPATEPCLHGDVLG